jgi:hypothetical protein
MGMAEANMGVAVGDVDGDELIDLFVTHLTEETHTLWKQGPRGNFQDHTVRAGLIRSSWRGTGFGTLLADFDHDGALDLVLANGRVSALMKAPTDALGPFWGRYADRNQVFAGNGKGHFRDVSINNPALCGQYNVARGLARGDIDGDGAQDLLLTTINGRARLFRNVAPGRGNWLIVRAMLPDQKRDAYGAEVRVSVGGRTRAALICPSESYACSSESVAHFGLGKAKAVDAIEVVWPDGSRETFRGRSANRRVVLNKGASHKEGGK